MRRTAPVLLQASRRTEPAQQVPAEGGGRADGDRRPSPRPRHSGDDAIPSTDQIRVTTSLKSQRGSAWTKNKSIFEYWEVKVTFRVTGRGRIGADGLAIWFTEEQGLEGPVFGAADKWNGVGIFFDSFDNDGKQTSSYIKAGRLKVTIVSDLQGQDLELEYCSSNEEFFNLFFFFFLFFSDFWHTYGHLQSLTGRGCLLPKTHVDNTVHQNFDSTGALDCDKFSWCGVKPFFRK
ncbi:uncharacterized protein LOC130143027 isoform X2 [Falco biarmicus]|uniref:uncharacterized protein LOC130143027 isoform X2 n=1 Tax=Falco biarmicus TaxID=345155 RepID=UPI0024BC17C1|nr:uncharacterized protein LOC130143027 isoform X2 [Falco biarmicus]